MSGGSFDYLYEMLPLPPESLRRMAEEAEAEKYPEGARALRRIIKHFIKIEADWQAAAEFMRAFEWWRSGDYGPEHVQQVEDKLFLPDRMSEKLGIALAYMQGVASQDGGPSVTYLHDPKTSRAFACMVNFELFDKLTHEVSDSVWEPMNHDHIEAEMGDEWEGEIADELVVPLARMVSSTIQEFLDDPGGEADAFI